MTRKLKVSRDKAAAGRFRKSDQEISSILASITDCHYELDKEWCFIRINDHALTYFGKKKEDIIGRSFWDVFPTTTGSVFEKQFRKAFSESISVHFDAQSAIVPDKWVEIHAYPTEEGGIAVFFRDITERKHTNNLLQSTLQRFYTILSSMYGAILLVTNDGFIEFANLAFCEYFGLDETPAELKGLTDREMIAKIKSAYLHHEEAISRIKQIVMEGKPVKNRRSHDDGREGLSQGLCSYLH